MANSPITPSVAPGNYYSPQTVSFAFDSTVKEVAFTQGNYPPSLSKYIAYDTLNPPNPFIAVTEDGAGKVVYDGGFPKIYNNSTVGWNGVGTKPSTFAALSPAHRYIYNALQWIAHPGKAKKLLVIGDRATSVDNNYLIKGAAGNGFGITLTNIATIAGFSIAFKDSDDYGGASAKLDCPLSELEQYAAVLFVSSRSGAVPWITEQCVNNLVAYRESGHGIFMITDHGYILNSINDVTNASAGFFKSANALASRFGAYFTGDYGRVPVNVGFLRRTYGDHPLYNGMTDSDNVAAGGSESMVVVTTTPMQSPTSIQSVTTTALGKSQYNLLASLNDGNTYTAKFLYNVMPGMAKPFELVITNAGRAKINAALASGVPITDYEVWHRPGVTTVLPGMTSIAGLARMGVPEIAANMSKTEVSFCIHLSTGTVDFYPRTLAIMSGDVLLGAVSVDLVGSAVDIPLFVPLVMRGVDSKAFLKDTNHTYSDILSATGFNTFLNAQETRRKQWMPDLAVGNTLYAQGVDLPAKSEAVLLEIEIVYSNAEAQEAQILAESIAEHQKVVVDLSSNASIVFDAGTWWATSQPLTAFVKPGHFVYSHINKKLYYLDGAGVLIDLTK